MTSVVLLTVVILIVYFKLFFVDEKRLDLPNPLHVGDINPEILNRQPIKPLDCQIEEVACFTNADCSVLCSAELSYCSHQGNCVLSKPEEKPPAKCNTAHGIVAVLTGDNATGSTSFECISLYPNIWTNDDKLVKGVCHQGNFNIDLTKEIYDPRKCKCPNSLVFRITDSYSLPIPRCVSKKTAEMLIGFETEKNEGIHDQKQSFHLLRNL